MSELTELQMASKNHGTQGAAENYNAVKTLTPLTDDEESYKEAYLNGFAKIACKEEILLHVTQTFDNVVWGKLQETFTAETDMRALGIGIGVGEHELNILQRLQSYYKRITQVVVEPNGMMLQAFKDKVRNFDLSKSVVTEVFHGTQQDFIRKRRHDDVKFNLITSVHSLYYVDDLEKTLEQLLGMLKPHGILLVHIQCEDDLMHMMYREKPWLLSNHNHKLFFTSKDVVDCVRNKVCDVTCFPMKISYDITELFQEYSSLGNRILDFFSSQSHFRDTAPAHVVKEIVGFCRGHSKRDDRGRFITHSTDCCIVVVNSE
ncbi:histamine N-methyltransferase-like [Diadema setosum]|uniref:histamine N-methyltransferase-like n=1 Tax=Diadema setosum TaxID=31175 RepID=UPI003B3B24FF